MRWIFALMLICIAGLTRADTVVPVSTIRANTVLTDTDVIVDPTQSGAGLSDVSDVIGMETRVVLYAGRPILPDYLIAPALVQRNEVVPLLFRQSGLSISTSGRVLDRGAAGDTVRVMNLSSRTTLFGTVLPDGSVEVSAPSGG
jgi:flagella basal body P-ring formation protein FlgA